MEGREAQVVVINADDSQTSFTFDALVENEDGRCSTVCARGSALQASGTRACFHWRATSSELIPSAYGAKIVRTLPGRGGSARPEPGCGQHAGSKPTQPNPT